MASHTVPRLNRCKVALSVSLVINLFLVALIGSHILRAHWQARYGGPFAQALASVSSNLPPKDAAVFRRTITSEAPAFAVAARQMAAARTALGQQIATDPYNPVAVRQSLEIWRANWNQFFDAFRGPLVDALGAISPEGRRQLIANRKAMRKNMPAASLAP